jgi:formyltetrahydrofolate deformylase
VIGRDKTGVIARITAFLFAQKANIEALEEQVTRGQFSMTLQASWQAKALDRHAVDAGLHALGQDLGMQVRARFTSTQHRQRGGILVSKEPHCLEGLIKAFKNGTLPAEAAVVISNHRVL